MNSYNTDILFSNYYNLQPVHFELYTLRLVKSNAVARPVLHVDESLAKNQKIKKGKNKERHFKTTILTTSDVKAEENTREFLASTTCISYCAVMYRKPDYL